MKITAILLFVVLALAFDGVFGYAGNIGNYERLGERRDALPGLFNFNQAQQWVYQAAQDASKTVKKAAENPDLRARVATATDSVKLHLSEAATTAGEAADSVRKLVDQTVDAFGPDVTIGVIDDDQIADVSPISADDLAATPVDMLQSHVSAVWAGFSDDLRAMGESALKSLADFVEWVGAEYDRILDWKRKNPKKAIAFSVMGFGLVLNVVPGAVSGPVLQILAFGPGGVVAQSVAAFVHGLIGDVAAGSIFAMLQSAGAGGYGLGIVNGGIRAAGGIVTSAAAVDYLNDLINEMM
ncbi:hypothetical protein C8034_v006545 [Colletotrichum sidae]|uniref:Uncharacterized protein n=1 Tax=Colletotrichum sidae TaxID=1347389 RepID=A0A4R8T5B8_9PEZI|nr:hypothetical protein C8034_v006545 [Colletotrichum sidae]